MSTLRVIQSGVGGHGRSWVRATGESERVEVVARADPDAAALAEAGGDVPGFASLAEAIAAVEADAVLSVTPPRLHLAQAREALDAGLHLLIEKPLAETLGDAAAIVDACAAAGRVGMVTQQRRWQAGPTLAKRLLDEQARGSFAHGHVAFYLPSDFRGTFRETMPHVLLIDMVVHHLDLLRHMTGRDIEAVYAVDFDPPHSLYHGAALSMVLDLTGGGHMTFQGDWCASGRSTNWNGDWRLQCTDGSVEYGGRGDEEHVTLARCAMWGEDVETERHAVREVDNPQVLALDHFADCVADGSEPMTSVADNLKTIAAVMAAAKSCETRQRVTIADVMNDTDQ